MTTVLNVTVASDRVFRYEEPEEKIVEIDETFSEKESSVTTVFSWSNFPVQNRGSAEISGAKRHKVDSSLVVIDSPPESPRIED